MKEKNEPLDALINPETKDFWKDPVVDLQGNTHEKDATDASIIQNFALKDAIEYFKEPPNNDLDSSDEPPDAFLDPITMEILVEPVINVKSGKTYEKATIHSWLEAHDTDPMTTVKTKIDDLVPNIALKQALDDYKTQKENKIIINEAVLALNTEPEVRPEQLPSNEISQSLPDTNEEEIIALNIVPEAQSKELSSNEIPKVLLNKNGDLMENPMFDQSTDITADVNLDEINSENLVPDRALKEVIEQLKTSEDKETIGLCPITQTVMVEPVINLASGISYEKEAIYEWIDNRSQTDPITRMPTTKTDLRPNKLLKLALSEIHLASSQENKIDENLNISKPVNEGAQQPKYNAQTPPHASTRSEKFVEANRFNSPILDRNSQRSERQSTSSMNPSRPQLSSMNNSRREKAQEARALYQSKSSPVSLKLRTEDQIKSRPGSTVKNQSSTSLRFKERHSYLIKDHRQPSSLTKLASNGWLFRAALALQKNALLLFILGAIMDMVFDKKNMNKSEPQPPRLKR
ncbi:MAG: U-box domain-containing protein [Tatlockia sp.]|nr:U-box domain-containing protein [Tatlockia sp.]